MASESRDFSSLPSHEPAENETFSWSRSAKEWTNGEYRRPQDSASNALALSIMVYIGAWMIVSAMNTIQDLCYTDQSFWFGSEPFGRLGAKEFCESGESILLAFPQSISESLASETGVVNVVIGNYLIFSAILLLTSNLGNPSIFPFPTGHWRTIFNTLRTIAPAMATFFVPTMRVIGPEDLVTNADNIVNYFHVVYALFAFQLSPVFELISSWLDLYFFFSHQPIGDNFIPHHPSKKRKDQRHRDYVGLVYKSLWVALTLARLAVAIFLLFYLNGEFGLWLGGTRDPPCDACGTLRTIKTYVLEKILIGLIAAMYLILSLSQMCESSGRRISSLFYILPLLVFALVGIAAHFDSYVKTMDMETNYLNLLNLEENGSVDFFPMREPQLEKCTSLLDLTTVSSNCFDLTSYPNNTLNCKAWG